MEPVIICTVYCLWGIVVSISACNFADVMLVYYQVDDGIDAWFHSNDVCLKPVRVFAFPFPYVRTVAW